MSNKTYGRPMMKELVRVAKDLGISVNVHISIDDGSYLIKTPSGDHSPPTVRSACFFMQGMIDLARTRAADLFTRPVATVPTIPLRNGNEKL